MNDKLIVKNFGAIQDIELDLLPCMVFIGKSGSGKSTIMKLISLMRWIHKKNCFRSFYRLAGSKRELNRFRFNNLLKESELEEFFSKKTYIYFSQNGSEYKVENGKLFVPKLKENHLSSEKIAFISENRGVLADALSFKNANKSLDYSYYLKDTFDSFVKALGELQKFGLASTNLVLQKKKSNNRDKLVIIGNELETFELSYERASSGTKNSTPVELITHYYTQIYDFKENMRQGVLNTLAESFMEQPEKLYNITLPSVSKEKLTLLIEEPELGLFPSNQRKLMNAVIRNCFNETKQKDVNLIISTHSPYLLNHLNLLIKAHDENNDSETNGASLDYDKLGVFLVENGKIKNLKALNMHYLDTQSLSDDINDIYEKYDGLKHGGNHD